MKFYSIPPQFKYCLPEGCEENAGKLNDCTVRSFAIATKIPYQTMLQHFHYICRPIKTGYNFAEMIKVLDELKIKYKVTFMQADDSVDHFLVKSFVYEKATLLVGCRDGNDFHVTVIKDNKFLDTSAKYFDYEVVFVISLVDEVANARTLRLVKFYATISRILYKKQIDVCWLKRICRICKDIDKAYQWYLEATSFETKVHTISKRQFVLLRRWCALEKNHTSSKLALANFILE